MKKRIIKICDFAFQSIIDIVDSPRVKQFCIGITYNPKQRLNSYATWCAKNNGKLIGFSLIAWHETPDDILQIEEFLFNKMKNDRSFSKLWKKHANHKNVKYFRNANRKKESQYLYIAWWKPAFHK